MKTSRDHPGAATNPRLFEIDDTSEFTKFSDEINTSETSTPLRIGLAGGGTGGHVYPIMAVKQKLQAAIGLSDEQFIYFGSINGPEAEICRSEGIRFKSVPASPIRSRSPLKLAKGIWDFLRGTRIAVRLLQEEPPDVIFVTGGYSAAPLCNAASKLGIPVVLFLPDVKPGWAARFIAKKAQIVLCSTSESHEYLGNTPYRETGYPVRPEFEELINESYGKLKTKAISKLGFSGDRPIALVVGGSLGSVAINSSILGELTELLEKIDIIHVSGRHDHERILAAVNEIGLSEHPGYQLLPYSDDMPSLMIAADIGVFRGGASVLGEAPATGLPLIVIPGNFSDQQLNAELLRKHGAAIILANSRVEELPNTILELIAQNADLERMRSNMWALARPSAAQQIASVIVRIAKKNEDQIPIKIHLIGAGGIHLSGIAEILLENGHRVTGSDIKDSDQIQRLRARGADILIGHDPANIKDADLIVTTAAAKADNPELLAGHARGIPIISRAEMVQKLIQGRQTIAIAGSHGKTTTSTLTTVMSINSSLDPLALIGGNMADLDNRNMVNGDGNLAIIEADEYADAFLSYTPSIAVITNVEVDHLDYFGTEENFFSSFNQFIERILPNGILLISHDDEGARKLRNNCNREDIRIESFSTVTENADWYAKDIAFSESSELTSFEIYMKGRRLGASSLRLTGDHNVSNFLAALAASMHAGADYSRASEIAASVKGARRRFELVGEVTLRQSLSSIQSRKVTVIDDYAHHPSEIKATIAAAKTRYPDRRLVICFQPHTYSRSSYLLDKFISCFEGIDKLLILDTFPARETEADGLSAKELLARLEMRDTLHVDSVSEAIDRVVNLLEPGDVFIGVGAGDVTDVPWGVLPRLQNLAWESLAVQKEELNPNN